MQTMTVPVQNTQNQSQTASFQWAQLCCLGLTEGKNAEAAKKHWNVHSMVLPYEKAQQTTISEGPTEIKLKFYHVGTRR